MNDIERVHFNFTGQVQGVGFRPFVYRLATGIGLGGWVINDARGVTIEVQGSAERVEEFSRRLRSELPPLAQIAKFTRQSVPVETGSETFEIRSSQGGELADAQVTVDTAVCADCLREMHDPLDPRHAYPFINCTNCGPRYTIVTAIPYDRPNTTMTDFAMCPLCRREYTDPACRRFHAQPIACPVCGPKVWLVDNHGVPIECEDAIGRTVRDLAEGLIVAIKGLGGFHLACRADDEHVVCRLRLRKRRDAKPFALMVANLDVARSICRVNDEAAALLAGAVRPIVVLPALPPDEAKVSIAPSVAQGLATLGVMLPYTPLHHMLFAQPEIAGLPLVMTSGNYHQEPLVKDNDAAIAHMGRIADVLLLHDRRIDRRVDDSVVQLGSDGQLIALRRARGYAPAPVRLEGLGSPKNAPAVLAVGGELKNTICLLQGGQALLSEHIGDLKDGRAFRHFVDTIAHLGKLFEVKPELIAADLHPQYLSTDYALKHESPGQPVVRVQHHFAHIVACLAENGFAGPAIGLACDGTGYGTDGAVWGCEVLLADLRGFQRVGHLRYIPLPGGDLAAEQTFRPAMSALIDTFGDEAMAVAKSIGLKAEPEQLAGVAEMIHAGVNCPSTSSLGRWFDAAAAMAGVATENAFEGQAPMLLESKIIAGVEDEYHFGLIDVEEGNNFVIDFRPMVEGIVRDVRAGAAAGVIAARFHNTVTACLLMAAERVRRETGVAVAALSGGCFANRYLNARLARLLAAKGFRVLRHNMIPCNDACVALGQAVVAAANSPSGENR